MLQSRHLSNALLQADPALARAELDQADQLGTQAAAALEQLDSSLQLPGAQALFGRVQASSAIYNGARAGLAAGAIRPKGNGRRRAAGNPGAG